MGISIGEHRPNQTRTGTRPPTGLPHQPHLVSVTSDSKTMSIFPVVMEFNHLPGVSQVPLGSVAATATVTVMASSRETVPPPKKARFSFLGVSSGYVCRVTCSSHDFLLLLSSYLNSKCDFWMIGVVPRVPRSFVDWSRARCLPRIRVW
jgi:hypothetical protein